jgi:hypothetical protein
MNKSRALLVLAVFLIVLESVSGCSVYMAAKQPPLKDMNVLSVGTKRDLVLAEFGNPVASGTENDCKYDIFSFTQGYSTGSKAGRAFLHGALDVLTIGIWEAVGTPIETIASGDSVKIKVIYDSNNCITNVVNLASVAPPREELPKDPTISP